MDHIECDKHRQGLSDLSKKVNIQITNYNGRSPYGLWAPANGKRKFVAGNYRYILLCMCIISLS